MGAIFQFFHNGQHWYSVSVDTQKTRDQNFWGGQYLKFFCMINIYEMAAIFQFFHNGWQWYSVSIDTWKTGQDANFPLVQFSLSPILGSVSMFKTFMSGHLCMVTFLHFIQESAKKNLPI